MQIIQTPDQALAALDGRGPLIASIGNFDGVHLGHRKLLDLAVTRARETGRPSLGLTFWPHPVEVFGRADFKYICAPDKKMELLAGAGLDLAYVLEFNPALAGLSARDFCARYLLPLGLSELFVGFDFHMGSDRAAGEELAQIGRDLGFHLRTAGAVMHGGEPISSTRIRRALAEGDLDLAAAMLGRPHAVRGEVMHGHGRGGPLLNMPTANIDPGSQLMPRPAIYATETRFPDRPGYPEKVWASVTSFGKNPTFGENVLSLETNLLDFNQDIYGELFEVSFLRTLREERKFASLEELSLQLKNDVEQRRELFI